MLFGESAGASDTYVVGTLPQASSLIKAGISESGGGRGLPSSAAANDFGQRWASSLDCNDAACLRSKSVSALNATLPTPTGPTINPSSVSGFGAFVDGQIIPVNPSDVGVQVPFIFGSNTQEGTLLILSRPGLTGPEGITPAAYQAYLNSTYGAGASLVAARYPVSAFNNTPYPAFYALVQVYTETNFWCSAYAGLNKAAQNGVPVWTYRWGQAPTCPWYNTFPPGILPIFGAAHTAEIPFVFANVDNNPPPNGNCSFTDAEKLLSKQMVGFWSGMAANGSPGAMWPQYSSASTAGINIVNGSSSVSPGQVDYSVCSFWNQVSAVALANGSSSATGSSSSGGPIATYSSGTDLLEGSSSMARVIAVIAATIVMSML